MTKIINELKSEGYNVTHEILSGLSPYRTNHINRYGKYSLDSDREVDILNSDLSLK